MESTDLGRHPFWRAVSDVGVRVDVHLSPVVRTPSAVMVPVRDVLRWGVLVRILGLPPEAFPPDLPDASEVLVTREMLDEAYTKLLSLRCTEEHLRVLEALQEVAQQRGAD